MNIKNFQFLILLFCVSIQAQNVQLNDFYADNSEIDKKVDSVFNTLIDSERVAQMIVTSAGELGKPNATVSKLAKENKIGGVIFLKGEKEKHKQFINELNTISKENNYLPLTFSIDAEPSLFNSRLKGSPKVANTIDITTKEESDKAVTTINNTLKEIGFQHNYAPVCDVSPNNEAIKNRSYGSDKDKVIEMSKYFIETSQEQGIVATAKHFPGHGLVKGDTHKKSVYIDGELQEVDVYKPLIDAGVISIMIAHITVNNNEKYGTDGLPSSCSRTIVTDLLKNELGFKGLIITDALNIMKAVTIIKDAPLQASKAGCDMLLMPIDEGKTINNILDAIKTDEAYKQQVYNSVKKILRLKVCLGLI